MKSLDRLISFSKNKIKMFMFVPSVYKWTYYDLRGSVDFFNYTVRKGENGIDVYPLEKNGSEALSIFENSMTWRSGF
jgi:hypothetical protein